MQELTQYTKFCLNYSTVNTQISKKLDNQLSIHGISFSEYMILFHLAQAREQKMRRIDLAEKIGLSASGITRLVAPMEKIGMVKKEANKRDARVSLVKLTQAGKRILEESSISINEAAEEILLPVDEHHLTELTDTLRTLGGTIR